MFRETFSPCCRWDTVQVACDCQVTVNMSQVCVSHPGAFYSSISFLVPWRSVPPPPHPLGNLQTDLSAGWDVTWSVALPPFESIILKDNPFFFLC